MLQSFRWGWVIAFAALGASASPSCAAEFEKFLPKETDMVMSLNLRQMIDSPIGKKYAADLVKSMLTNNKQIQQTLNSLGLDPLTDFRRISTGIGLDDLSNPKAVVVVEGKFDDKKINGMLDQLAKNEPEKFSMEKAAGRTIFKIAAPDLPLPMYGAAIDANLMIFSPVKELVGAAFVAQAAQKDSPKPEIKKELADLLAKADPKASFFLVAHTKGKLDSVPLPDAEMKKLIEQIHSIAAELKVEQDVQLELSIGAAGADEAKKVRDIVAGGIDFMKIQVKLAVGQQPELQPLVNVINTMTAIQKEKQVIVAGKLTGEELEKMLKK
jgi:hypothetical protein